MIGEHDLLEQYLSRRRFLFLTGLAGASVYATSARKILAAPPQPGPSPVPSPNVPLTFTANVRRRRDFVSLRFDFYNLQLDDAEPANPVVRRKQAAKSSFLVVTFPPQNTAEQAFHESAPEFAGEPESGGGVGAMPAPGTVNARMAGESRLSFLVPNGVEIPFTVAGLLAWAGLQQNVAPVAKTIGRQDPGPKLKLKVKPQIRVPQETETALELPWQLVVSPNEHAGWKHAPGEVTHGGRTELWHTRLGIRKEDGVDEDDPVNRTIRGIWALDFGFKQAIKNKTPPTDGDVPFKMSLTPRDRYEIVRATADYRTWTPEPVDVERLMLSSLGAWIDSRGAWDDLPVAEIDLEEWRQRGTMGRDHYVRIVKRGFLFPFGHRASLIKITERKFETSTPGRLGAYLRQRIFIVVRQPDVAYAKPATGQPFLGRKFPFTNVRITTLVTPNLDERDDFVSPLGDLETNDAWMPHVGSSPFLFHMIGTDRVGRREEFTTPVVFVLGTSAVDAAEMTDLIAEYNTAADGVRSGDFQGQEVALAPSVEPGDTSVEVATMIFGAEAPAGAVLVDRPLFFPTMAKAKVRLGPAEQASGQNVTPEIEYDTGAVSYVTNGFGAGGIFAKVVPTPLEFPADKSGGVVTPNFSITGLSRTLGPTGGDIATVRGGTFEPQEVFGSLGKILGGVDLFEIINSVQLLGGAPESALKITYRSHPDRLETLVAWKPDLKADPLGIFDPDAIGPASLNVDATILTHLTDPSQSTFSVVGDLRDFRINLIGANDPLQFLELNFNRLMFESKQGQKASVDVDIASTEFHGVLKFVEKLQEIIGGATGGGGPSIDVTPTGITTSLSIPIPSIQVGVFGLSNMSFGAGLNIPFSGKPVRVRFNFSTREDMFCIQVSMFGGGGFFALGIGADGVEQIEAALEFGATIALDIGVASGSVHLMAGVYFSYSLDEELGEENLVLTGYVRLGGELCVMGIVSLSLEFYMGITYERKGDKDKVYGEASLTVTVEVLLFSGEVSMTVRRQFGNAPADPTFADQLDEPGWAEYCAAFAPVAA